MCFEFDALPPDLPAGRAVIAGGAAAESLILSAADGNQFAAAFAESPEPSGPGVVILPDIRGLYRFYVELAERFAEAGHHAIAFDYFGRTAGVAERDEDFDFKPHVAATTIEGVQADLLASREALAAATGATQFASVGFCFGGSHSFWAGSNLDLGLDAVVGFYGGLKGSPDKPGRPDLTEHADQIKLPLLGLFGGGDEHITAEHREAFDSGLERAGIEHEIVVYPGAPHSFFDRKQEEFAEASTDAWTKVLDFLAAEPAAV